MLNTPVLFLIFNRPDHVRVVFEAIRKQQPKQLFVHADGPRKEIEGDIKKCQESRSIIQDTIDWDCELKVLFRDENLGCGKGPASAISWFFDNVSEGIIIEDDCLPHPDFFEYCAVLLNRYRDDKRIMVIGGTTYRDDYPCEYSYTFTLYGTMAAWATWKRVWEKFNFTLSDFTRDNLNSRLRKLFQSNFEYKTWIGLYDWIVKDEFRSYWDWQLHFTLFYYNGIAIRPKKNMISNIGFGPDASHTSYTNHSAFQANRPVFGCLPLTHPPEVQIDKKRDSVFYKKMYQKPLYRRIFQSIYLTLFQGKFKNQKIILEVLKRYRRIKIFLNLKHEL